MAIVAAIAAVAGSVLSYVGQERQASAAKANADFQRRLAYQQAGQEEASAQQAAFNEQRRARLLESRSVALASASGAGASDPTAIKLLSGISAEGAYRAGMDLYSGEEKARYLRMTGQAEQMQGNSAAQAYDMSAVSGLASNVGSFYTKYGAPREQGGFGWY